ncbi:MAG: PP0621 family protein [Methylotenera sp.]|uniref:PP0621 family protein n=1 Tax=Methylotenera sp. TaxID=2051956 RepID=UPI002489913C|nr:PP0621 family protein [Methylotenera sp.]MDI1309190.1 PP0621 family protein [Methylotenera sp.]
MWRLIFLGLIIYLLIVIYKRSKANTNNDKNNNKETSAKEQEKENNEIENMVQCASCSVHLPRSEAFLVNGEFYCSKTHIPK